MQNYAAPATHFILTHILGASLLWAQPSPPSPAAHKSVRGTLDSVDKLLNRVIMKTDAGERLAWRFSPAMVAAVAKFDVSSPMIVIYRQITSNEKRVTAVAFPGTTATPVYVNLTGSRVVIRSGAAVAGVCGAANAGPVTESVIPPDGRAEVLDACWCCAPVGSTCTTGNKSGLGQAFLEQCFE